MPALAPRRDSAGTVAMMSEVSPTMSPLAVYSTIMEVTEAMDLARGLGRSRNSGRSRAAGWAGGARGGGGEWGEGEGGEASRDVIDAGPRKGVPWRCMEG